MTLKPFKQDDAKSLSELAERRKMQHVANEKSNLKTKTKVETVPFSKGDIVMYRDVTNYDAARDTFIVIDEDNTTGVRIRKFKNQLRMKTYQVKREQLILIFSPEDLSSKQKESVDSTKVFLPNKRKAAIKSAMKTHQMAVDKVITIKRKKKKKTDEKK